MTVFQTIAYFFSWSHLWWNNHRSRKISFAECFAWNDFYDDDSFSLKYVFDSQKRYDSVGIRRSYYQGFNVYYEHESRKLLQQKFILAR